MKNAVLTVRLSLDDHAIIHEMASALGQRPSTYVAALVSLHAAAHQLRLILAAKGMDCDLPFAPTGQVASRGDAAFHGGIPLPAPHSPAVPRPTTIPSIPIRLSLPTSVINVLRASSPDGKAETAAGVVAHGEAVECRRTRRAAIEECLSRG